MAGGIILSRRLERMHQAARDLGDTFEGIRVQQRKTKLEDEDRAAEAKSRGLRDRAATAAADVADLQLGEFKRRDAARQEAEGLAGELAGFGQAVPDSTITAPADGALPGFQGMRSERPAVDASADSLKDRLRASWMNAEARAKGETSAFTADDVRRQREEAAAKKQRESEEYTLGIDKSKADIERTKAGTETEKMQQKKLKAELDQLAKGGMDPEKVATVEGKLRGEFINQNKAFMDVRDAYSRIQASEDTAAGDVALIFNYMKMLDPGSTVREGEFATAEQVGNIPTRILNQYNKAVSGERVKGSRQQFMSQAKKLYESQKDIYTNSAKTYMGLAADYGVNPGRVVVDLEGGVRGASGPAGAGPGGAAPAASGPRQIATKEEWAALPPGTSYIGPDGKRATKR
jgi:hypothetical protein